MHHLILFILAADKAMRVKKDLGIDDDVNRFDCHGLLYDAKLVKCATWAREAGWLWWRRDDDEEVAA